MLGYLLDGNWLGELLVAEKEMKLLEFLLVVGTDEMLLEMWMVGLLEVC